MADEPTQPQSPPPRARRSSFAGQTFADLFSGSRPSTSARGATNENNSPPPTQQMPGTVTQAAAQAQQRRRMSLTTLGLSGSPTQNSFFGGRPRQDSMGSANSSSIDESAIAEDDGPAKDGNPPSSPFARRTSFGARALRDIRTSSFSGGQNGGGGSPTSPGQNGTKSPSNSTPTRKAHNGTISSRDAKGRGPSGEGFNWSDNLRNRAERTSVAAQGVGGGNQNHTRAKSVAVMEPPPAAQMPKPKERPRPDHFQERILKGDFYMD